MNASNHSRRFLVVATLLSLAACGGGESQQQVQRGAPALKGGGDAAGGKAGPAAAAGPTAEDPDAPPQRPDDAPSQLLTREDFGPDSRDPFRSFLDEEGPAETTEEPTKLITQRDVKLSDYNFEDLSLIGTVVSGRGVQPRALFVSSDGISKTVKQGEYFSRAEVLLASVNRDYVEIEVVDEELAKGLNLAAGETRAIYLTND